MTTTEPAPGARNLDWWPAAWVALGTGLIWIVVVLYRALGRGIGGEVSYSLVAGAGLVIAAALGWVQTRPMPRSGTVAAIAVVAAIALSALLTVAVYYLGASLAGS